MLGNFKHTPTYFNGGVIGGVESSDDIKVGKNSWGATYDGKAIQRISLDLHAMDAPEVTLDTGIDLKGSYILGTDGAGSLDDWEDLFTDVLAHIQQLKLDI